MSIHRIIRVGAIVALLFGPTAVAVLADLSTPEATLDGYIDSLKNGDASGVLKRYHGINEFTLPRPIPIQEYSIEQKITFTALEVAEWNGKGIVPRAQIGDIEFHVKELIDGMEQMYSYALRNYEGVWQIYSHYAWGVD